MKNYSYLNITGTNLNENQLDKYLKKSAEEQLIAKRSDKNTYPMTALKKDFYNIFLTYELLNKHLKLGIKIHSAGEWLLDNFYIIEETVRNIEKSINKRKYVKLPGIANGNNKGYARIYVLASEIVAFNDEIITEEIILKSINSYQMRKILSMEEIWNIGIFIQIATIQKIARICEKIYYSELQKYKVEKIFEKRVQGINNKNRHFKEKIKKEKNISGLNYSFIEYMVYKLRRIRKKRYTFFRCSSKADKPFGYRY